MSDIRPYGPGKFSTIPDAAIFNLAQEGVDEELAFDGFGWAGLIRLAAGETLLMPESFGSVELNEDERSFLQNQTAGCILRESTDGFVDVNYFTAADELASAWRDVQEDYATFAGDDDLMDGDPGSLDVPDHRQAAQHIRRVAGSEIERTLNKAVATLHRGGIASLVVGGYAVQEHGYPRFTHDVDLVVPDVSAAWEYLSIRGFRPNPGSSMTLTDRETKVEVDLLPAGGHVGPGPLAFPTPTVASHVPTVVDLPTLLSLKLSSYIGNTISRLQDAADVVALIKANDLPVTFAVAPEVHDPYVHLWRGLHPVADEPSHTDYLPHD